MRYGWIFILIISGTSLWAQSTPCYDCAKIVFIVDNSGSVDQQLFNDMKSTADQLSSQYIALNNNLDVAIVQYATLIDIGIDHQYDISVPFTNNAITASTWTRFYNNFDQDHLPASLAEMRLDGVWGFGGSLDITSGNCKVVFVIITDAFKGFASCCSALINQANAPSALPNYDEYNYLKTTYGAEFIVIHGGLGVSGALDAGAAISSVGGTYVGIIDNNPGDPQGNGTLPRKYYQPSVVLSQLEMDSIAVQFNFDICDTSISNPTSSLVSSLFVPNVFTPNGDDDNNLFSITKENITRIEGVIYNRWGLKMAEWNTLDYAWDGKTMSGKEAPDGTYYYIIKAEGVDQKEYLEKGYLTLIR